MRLIQRWLRGEIVDDAVGIRLRGGSFDGRIRIVDLARCVRQSSAAEPRRDLRRPGVACLHTPS